MNASSTVDAGYGLHAQGFMLDDLELPPLEARSSLAWRSRVSRTAGFAGKRLGLPGFERPVSVSADWPMQRRLAPPALTKSLPCPLPSFSSRSGMPPVKVMKLATPVEDDVRLIEAARILGWIVEDDFSPVG